MYPARFGVKPYRSAASRTGISRLVSAAMSVMGVALFPPLPISNVISSVKQEVDCLTVYSVCNDISAPHCTKQIFYPKLFMLQGSNLLC